MIITVDSNIIFSALYSGVGASHRILRQILDEKIKLAITPPVFFEYADVLTRPESLTRLELGRKDVEDMLDVLALLAQKQGVYYLLRPNLPDEADNMFVECAFVSGSDYLITGNSKDYRRGELRGFGFKVITPREFLQQWSHL